MGSVHTPMSWILAPLLRHPKAGAVRGVTGRIPGEMDGKAPDEIAFDQKKPGELTGWQSQTAEPVAFADLPAVPPALDYPDAALADIPAKLTATGRKTDYKSVEAAEDTRPVRPAPALRRPDFDSSRYAA